MTEPLTDVQLDQIEAALDNEHTGAVTLKEFIQVLLADARRGRPIRTAHGDCLVCRLPFDPADLRWNGRGRYLNTQWCNGCVDRCHDNDSADHRCPICV